MQEPVFILEGKPTKLLLKARQIDLIPKSSKSAYEKGSTYCQLLHKLSLCFAIVLQNYNACYAQSM